LQLRNDEGVRNTLIFFLQETIVSFDLPKVQQIAYF
jgi:hypothetical protein